ncbi:AmmeMemoRadiSam system protein B [Thermodesulfobacteriota bacterium]
MSGDEEKLPRLRNVDVIQLALEGRPAVGLRDPLQLSDMMVCVGQEALPVLARLDGLHSMRDLQWELTRNSGRLVFTDSVQEMLDRLDEAFLLENERFREALQRKVVEYRKSPFRPSSHAGLSYSDDTETLTSDLNGFFTGPGGPGTPEYFSQDRRPKGLVAPHIDIRSGGACFAHGYHALASGKPSDLYVIFGTGHAGVADLFSATSLDFQTPLGTVRTDRDFLRELSDSLGQDACAEELLHATEHVIEFQIVFLQHVFGGRHNFEVVPILVSLSPLFFDSASGFEAQKAHVKNFCNAVKEACRKTSKSVCFIASADLDHIGPRYGDGFQPSRGMVSEALEKDREMIGHLEKLNVAGFIDHALRENDSQRICGFSPITAMLHCMDASSGHLLDLDYAEVDDQKSFVSFCSVVFY